MADATGDPARRRPLACKSLAPFGPLDIDPATHALTFAKGHPYDQSHRHFSHAMAIHPLGLITIEGSDDDRKTIAATLDQIEAKGTKQWCGYSFAWFKHVRPCDNSARAPQVPPRLRTHLHRPQRLPLERRPIQVRPLRFHLPPLHARRQLPRHGSHARDAPAILGRRRPRLPRRRPLLGRCLLRQPLRPGQRSPIDTRRYAGTVSVTILAEAPESSTSATPSPAAPSSGTAKCQSIVGSDWTIELKVGDEVTGHAIDLNRSQTAPQSIPHTHPHTQAPGNTPARCHCHQPPIPPPLSLMPNARCPMPLP